jgi:hypothetical protein
MAQDARGHRHALAFQQADVGHHHADARDPLQKAQRLGDVQRLDHLDTPALQQGGKLVEQLGGRIDQQDRQLPAHPAIGRHHDLDLRPAQPVVPVDLVHQPIPLLRRIRSCRMGA